MHVAFAGPPDYPDLDKVRERVRQLSPEDVIALITTRRGAFYRALRNVARERNVLVVTDLALVYCHRAVAFAGPSGLTSPVESMIEGAKILGIPLEIIGAGS